MIREGKEAAATTRGEEFSPVFGAALHEKGEEEEVEKEGEEGCLVVRISSLLLPLRCPCLDTALAPRRAQAMA